MHDLAVAGGQETQPEHPPLGHVLYLRLADGVHCLGDLFVGGVHAIGSAAFNLVDHAADLYPDHHLYLGLSEDV